MSERYHDLASGLTCPSCSIGDKLYYRVIPSPTMMFHEDGTQFTFHFGNLRDYTCDNCDFNFLVQQDEIDRL